jgi:hypothetical protein
MSSIDKESGAAFPFAREIGMHGSRGMSLRDYFAAKALQGLLSSPRETVDNAPLTGNYLASMSYKIADAMLAARTPKETDDGT